MRYVLQAKELHKVLAPGQPPVLEGLSLRVPQGSRLGLLGLNGAGKTTLARTLAALIRPDHGRILIDGDDPWYGDRAARKRARAAVRLLAQDPNTAAHPRLTVTEALAETLRSTRRPLTKAARDHRAKLDKAPGDGSNPFGMGTGVGHGPQEDAPPDSLTGLDLLHSTLETFGLAHRAHAFPFELSGGEKRRLGLARALLAPPRILILDEPTSGLDIVKKADIVQLLASKCPSTTTLILVSHDPDVLRGLCTEVALIHRGRLLEHFGIRDLHRGSGCSLLCEQLLESWEVLER